MYFDFKGNKVLFELHWITTSNKTSNPLPKISKMAKKNKKGLQHYSQSCKIQHFIFQYIFSTHLAPFITERMDLFNINSNSAFFYIKVLVIYSRKQNLPK